MEEPERRVVLAPRRSLCRLFMMFTIVHADQNSLFLRQDDHFDFPLQFFLKSLGIG